MTAISIPIAGIISLALVTLAEKIFGGTIQVSEITRIAGDYL